MLVAAAAGAGYGIGRNVDGDDTADEPAAAGGSPNPVPRAAVGRDDRCRSTRSAAETTEPAFAAVDMRQDVGVRSSRWRRLCRRSARSRWMRSSNARPTDGLTLRVGLGEMWDVDRGRAIGVQATGGPRRGATSPGRCALRCRAPASSTSVGSRWYSEPFQGRAVSWLLLGGNDGAPQWVVVVQAPAQRHERPCWPFPTARPTRRAPQGGIAALTVRAPPPSSPVTEGGRTYWIDPTPLFEVSFEGGAGPRHDR